MTVLHTNVLQGGLQQRSDEPYEERERVYIKRADGTLMWLALKQISLSRVKAKKQALIGMVMDVGGNPRDFRDQDEMARFLLDRERPLDVVREIDAGEAYSMDEHVDMPEPLDTDWFAGTYRNGNLVIEPSTEDVVLDKY